MFDLKVFSYAKLVVLLSVLASCGDYVPPQEVIRPAAPTAFSIEGNWVVTQANNQIDFVLEVNQGKISWIHPLKTDLEKETLGELTHKEKGIYTWKVSDKRFPQILESIEVSIQPEGKNSRWVFDLKNNVKYKTNPEKKEIELFLPTQFTAEKIEKANLDQRISDLKSKDRDPKKKKLTEEELLRTHTKKIQREWHLVQIDFENKQNQIEQNWKPLTTVKSALSQLYMKLSNSLKEEATFEIDVKGKELLDGVLGITYLDNSPKVSLKAGDKTYLIENLTLQELKLSWQEKDRKATATYLISPAQNPIAWQPLIVTEELQDKRQILNFLFDGKWHLFQTETRSDIQGVSIYPKLNSTPGNWPATFHLKPSAIENIQLEVDGTSSSVDFKDLWKTIISPYTLHSGYGIAVPMASLHFSYPYLSVGKQALIAKSPKLSLILVEEGTQEQKAAVYFTEEVSKKFSQNMLSNYLNTWKKFKAYMEKNPEGQAPFELSQWTNLPSLHWKTVYKTYDSILTNKELTAEKLEALTKYLDSWVEIHSKWIKQ